MPRPEDFLRNCQIDRGTPDIHDVPQTLTTFAVGHYIDRGGRKRRVMRFQQSNHASHYDHYLVHREESRVIDLDGLVRFGRVYRKDLTN